MDQRTLGDQRYDLIPPMVPRAGWFLQIEESVVLPQTESVAFLAGHSCVRAPLGDALYAG